MNNRIKRVLIYSLLALSIGSNAEDTVAVSEYIKQGDLAFDDGMHKKVLSNFQRASRDATDKQALFLRISNTFLSLADFSSTLTVVEKILTENPNHEDALLIKGQVFEGQDNPDKTASYYLQANVLRKMDKDDKARQVLVELTDRVQ